MCLDADADFDGTPDHLDACPTDAAKTVDDDTDRDGVLDCNDVCPFDANTTSTGAHTVCNVCHDIPGFADKCLLVRQSSAPFANASTICSTTADTVWHPTSRVELEFGMNLASGGVWLGMQPAGVGDSVDWRWDNGDAVTQHDAEVLGALWLGANTSGTCAVATREGLATVPCDGSLNIVVCQRSRDPCTLGDGRYRQAHVAAPGSSIGCAKRSSERKTRDEAAADCAADGAVLAQPRSAADGAAVAALLGSDAYGWIGLKQQEQRGYWAFDDGSVPFQFAPWGLGPPSDSPSDCAVASLSTSWHNHSCDTLLYYVCTYPDTCNSHSITCENGGTCVNKPGGAAQCVCPEGYGGGRCQYNCSNVLDTDGDGVPDCTDQCPYDPLQHSDMDSDGDLVPDCADDCPLNRQVYMSDVDTDFDGLLDCNECTDRVDADGNGVLDCNEPTTKCVASISNASDTTPCLQFRQEAVSFSDAVHICESNGMQLWHPASRDEAMAGWNISKSALDVWIAARGTPTGWRWLDETSAVGVGQYMGWSLNEPSFQAGCGVQRANGSTVEWTAGLCDEKHAFVCTQRYSGCALGWSLEPATGTCFKRLPGIHTWDEARTSCQDAGGVLAPVDNEQSFDFLVGGMMDGDTVWLGASDAAVEGTFTNEDGSEFGFTRWRAGAPDGGTDENCLGAIDGEHDDFPCFMHYAAVCAYSNRCILDADPCLNGGACMDDGHHVSCVCPSGYGGRYCHRKCSVEEDTDLDGFNDCEDECPRDGLRHTSDGVDEDGDGYPTCDDFCPLDSSAWTIEDRNHDGMADCHSCPPGWVPADDNPGICYMFKSTAGTRDSARQLCNAEGATLAMPRTLVQGRQLGAMVHSNGEQRVWIGLHIFLSTWQWFDGDPPGAVPGGNTWAPGQPSGGNGCGVGGLVANDEGSYDLQWMNSPFSCGSSLPVVCELRTNRSSHCMPGWNTHRASDQCIQYFPEGPSFRQAQAECARNGATLATMHDQQDRSTLFGLWWMYDAGYTLQHTWVGLASTGHYHWWFWMDEVRAEYFPWEVLPSNSQTASCGVQREFGRVVESGCGYGGRSHLRYVCQYHDACGENNPCRDGQRCISTGFSGAVCQCPPMLAGPNCSRPCLPTVDTDGDGVNDCVDECPLDPERSTDVDSDGDGYPDCIDECPYDPGAHSSRDDGGALTCGQCTQSTLNATKCYIHVAGLMTFDGARANCIQLGGDLARLAGPGDAAAAAGGLAGDAWLGLHRNVDEPGTWSWLDGTPASDSFLPWDEGHPSGGSSCAVAHQFAPNETTVREAQCSQLAQSICEVVRDRHDHCPSGWASRSRKCVLIHPVALSWRAANKVCETLGTHLPSVHQPQLQHTLAMLGHTDELWIGLSDEEVEGVYAWTDGTPLDFSAWRSGQPDNDSSEDCVVQHPDGTWSNELCDAALRKFACSYPDRCVDFDPCVNGGFCTSLPSNVTCTCRDGYTGDHCEDACPEDPNKLAPGECGCGIPDTDTDSDGVADCYDRCPTDAARLTDADSDGDGILDCNDHCPDDAELAQDGDADGDGTPDCVDACPFDSTRIADVDSDDDGYLDCNDDCPHDASMHIDTDGDSDGVPDCVDGCPQDPDKTQPGVCGCGQIDSPSNTADDDNDFVANCLDGCPTHQNKQSPGVCGCGVPDIDTDGDGTYDCNDDCVNDPFKSIPGFCGCGVPDGDSDGDGFEDCVEDCPFDANKVTPGDCGCGVDEDSCRGAVVALVVGSQASGCASGTCTGNATDAAVVVLELGSGNVTASNSAGGHAAAWLCAASNPHSTGSSMDAVVLGGYFATRPAGSVGAPRLAGTRVEAVVAAYPDTDAVVSQPASPRWLTAFGHAIDGVSASIGAVTVIAAPETLLEVVVAAGSYSGGRLQLGPHSISGPQGTFVVALSLESGDVLWVYTPDASWAVASAGGPASLVSMTQSGSVGVCLPMTDMSSLIVAITAEDGSPMWLRSVSAKCTSLQYDSTAESLIVASTKPSGDSVMFELHASTGATLREHVAEGASLAAVVLAPQTPGVVFVAGTSLHPEAGLHGGIPGRTEASGTSALLGKGVLPSSFGNSAPRARYRCSGRGHEFGTSVAMLPHVAAVASDIRGSVRGPGQVGGTVVARGHPTGVVYFVSLPAAIVHGQTVLGDQWGVTGPSAWISVARLDAHSVLCAGHFHTSSRCVVVLGQARGYCCFQTNIAPLDFACG